MLTISRQKHFEFSLSAKRPCLLMLAAFVFGILTSYFAVNQPLSIYTGLILLLFAVAMAFFRQEAFQTAVIVLMVFFTGFLLTNWTVYHPRADHIDNLLSPDEHYELSGIVDGDLRVKPANDNGIWTRSAQMAFTMKVTRFKSADEWKPARGKVQVRCFGRAGKEAAIGDVIEVKGKLIQPKPPRNPGGFDYRRYLKYRGIRFQLYIYQDEDLRIVGQRRGSGLKNLLFDSKKTMHHQIMTSNVNSRVKQLQYAMLLGEREEIDPDLRQKLIDTNTIHILAISGLHIGILMVSVMMLLRLFMVPKTITSLAAIAAAMCYAVMTGFNPPAVRALVVGTAILMAPMFRRYSDNLNSTALAGLVLLTLNPLTLFQPGFQLSFVVVISIILLTRRIEKLLLKSLRLDIDPGYLTISRARRLTLTYFRYPFRVFAVSLAAFLGAMPLVAAYYNRINPVSFISNVFVVPLVGAFVPGTFFRTGVGLVFPAALFFFDAVNNALGSAIIFLIELFSRLRVFSISIKTPPIQAIILYYAALLAVGLTPRFKRSLKYLAAVGMAGLITFAVMHLTPSGDYLEVIFLDVSHGEAIFVRTPDGKTLLIDGGSIEIENVGKRVLLPFLRSRGVRKLDYLLVTHFELDHYSGLTELVRRMPVGQILWRPVVRDSIDEPLAGFFSMVEAKKIPTREVKAGDVIEISPRINFRLVSPAPELVAARAMSENDASIVAKLSYGSSSWLLCGDIESGMEWLLLNEEPGLESTVIKVPHHGSATSSSEKFIEAVYPRAAVISCGRFSPKPRAFSEVVQRYLKRDIKMFRTDLGGAIQMRIYRDRIKIFTTLPDDQ